MDNFWGAGFIPEIFKDIYSGELGLTSIDVLEIMEVRISISIIVIAGAKIGLLEVVKY